TALCVFFTVPPTAPNGTSTLSLPDALPILWTGPELADEMRVTTRTVRRDVDRLRQMGYPVLTSAGHGGGYQLGAGRALPPLLLSSPEAVAVAVGLRLAASSGIDGLRSEEHTSELQSRE